MTDDWTPPTDEYVFPCRDRATAAPTADASAPRHGDVIEPVLGLTPGDLRIVDAFFYELALEAAEDPRPPTAEEQLAIDNLASASSGLRRMSPEELDAERERLRKAGW